jgi:hypothetical protein
MGAYQAKRSGENVYKGAMIGGIRAIISSNPIGAIADSSMVGAIQARKAGKNPWAGAMLGGTVAAVSSAVSKGMGGLPGTSAAGGFSAMVNAAAYRQNPWKAALYGGLYSVAYAATVQGAITLSQSIIGYGNTPTADQESVNKARRLVAGPEFERTMVAGDKGGGIGSEYYTSWEDGYPVFRDLSTGQEIHPSQIPLDPVAKDPAWFVFVREHIIGHLIVERVLTVAENCHVVTRTVGISIRAVYFYFTSSGEAGGNSVTSGSAKDSGGGGDW